MQNRDLDGTVGKSTLEEENAAGGSGVVTGAAQEQVLFWQLQVFVLIH